MTVIDHCTETSTCTCLRCSQKFSNGLISTLQLRKEALKSGELDMYVELLRQRGLEVPTWLQSIRSHVNAGLKLPMHVVPSAWVPQRCRPEPSTHAATCPDCHTEFMVDLTNESDPFGNLRRQLANNWIKCPLCQELHDVTRENLERWDPWNAPLRTSRRGWCRRWLANHDVVGWAITIFFVTFWVWLIFTMIYETN